MPKLWSETIEAHRHDVREAILDATAALVAEHGLRSPTMSQIAERAGIGRATLYKYFPDLEAVLLAWHQRTVARRLARLKEAAGREGTAGERLAAVLEAFAFMVHETHRQHDAEISAILHRDPEMSRAHQEVRDLMCGLLSEAMGEGCIRTDIPPEELASFCRHALMAARTMSSPEAVRRLVAVVHAGLHSPG